MGWGEQGCTQEALHPYRPRPEGQSQVEGSRPREGLQGELGGSEEDRQVGGCAVVTHQGPGMGGRSGESRGGGSWEARGGEGLGTW